jgi:hypothetical protein
MAVRIRYWIALVAALLFGSPSFAQSYFMDGNRLSDLCSKSDATSRDLCTVYIEGASDGVMYGELSGATAVMLANNLGSKEVDAAKSVCLPSDVKFQQVREVVVNDLRAHPETRHNSAAYLVYSAISVAFPCRK